MPINILYVYWSIFQTWKENERKKWEHCKLDGSSSITSKTHHTKTYILYDLSVVWEIRIFLAEG